MADAFQSALLPCLWRGISFPLTSIKADTSHDVARHKRIDRRGSRVEGTGLNSLVFVVEIPFLTSLVPGQNEQWESGTLFPKVYLEFLEAFADRSTGEFQHPVRGVIKCKPISMQETFDADHRQGVVVSAVFEETVESEEDEEIPESPLASLKLAGIDLQVQAGQLNPPIYPTTDDGLSLDEAISEVTGAIGKVSIAVSSVAGTISKIENTVQKVKTAASVASGAVADVVAACNKVTTALTEVKKSLNVKSKPTKFHPTLTKTTFGALSPQLRTSVADLITLNSHLTKTSIIQAGTLVRYYVS